MTVRNMSAAAFAALCLVACQGIPLPPDHAGWQAGAETALTEKELKKEAKRLDKAWRSLASNTDVRQVGGDRLVIDAFGRMGTDLETIELRLIARSAAEAKRLGFSHFAIVHLADRNFPVAGSIFPDFSIPSEKTWIGSYEELLYNRQERSEAAPPRTWIAPGLTAVVFLLDEDDRRANRSFNASDTYLYVGQGGLAR